MITAKEARELATENSDYSDLLIFLLDEIRREAKQGNTSLEFYTGGEHLSDDEEGLITTLGFEISWNSPCLWYEINW